MKKFLASLLIVTFLIGNLAAFATPRKAEAFWGLGDISFDPPTTVQTTTTAVNVGKDLVIQVLKSVLRRLANKVLQKMLKKTVNWAVTGFGPWEDGGTAGGQPFYVQNQDSLIKNIEDQQLLSTIQELGDGCKDNDCPYAKDLARTLVRNAISSNKNSVGVFDGDQYSDNWQGFVDGQFSEGGWAAWEAMYRNPQNSQFGSFLTTAFHVDEKKQTSVGKQVADLNQNAGFLSLRECVAFADGKEPTSEIDFAQFTKKHTTGDEVHQDVPGDTYDWDKTYSAGDHVVYLGTEYEAIQESTGTPPGGNALSKQYWGQVGQTLGSYNQQNNPAPNPQTTYTANEYSATTPYKKADRVSYFNNIFEASKDVPVGTNPSTSQTSGTYWTFIAKNGVNGNSIIGSALNNLENTYAFPGLTVDNCIRYETITPGSMAKEMLGKTLTSTIDKQIADSTTGNSILDSLVDMAAVFVEQGLNKLITKATTKTGDQKVFAGGIGEENTVYLGAGNGASTNSAWYSENGKDPIIIQDPYDATKLHPDLIEEMKLTQQELDEVNIILDMLRSQPDMFRTLDECLPGPDIGWEQRLKDEFMRSSKRLDKKSIKDNKKGDKAQEAISRLERYRDQEISKTKLAMLTVIPNAIPILGKIPTLQNLASDLRQAEQKLTQKTSALAVLKAIQESLASGTANDFELVELKKQYSGIKNFTSKEETLQDTLEDKQRIIADIFTSFDQANPKSLISKCIEDRKKLTDVQIGEDLGQTLFCSWQTHDTSREVTKTATGEIVTFGTSGGTKTTETAGISSSPYDPGRNVQILIGNRYTQDEAPFDDGGKNGEFQVDCNKYYRASMSVYEDNK